MAGDVDIPSQGQQLMELHRENERLRAALKGLYDSLPRYSCKADAPDGCPVCVAREVLAA